MQHPSTTTRHPLKFLPQWSFKRFEEREVELEGPVPNASAEARQVAALSGVPRAHAAAEAVRSRAWILALLPLGFGLASAGAWMLMGAWHAPHATHAVIRESNHQHQRQPEPPAPMPPPVPPPLPCPPPSATSTAVAAAVAAVVAAAVTTVSTSTTSSSTAAIAAASYAAAALTATAADATASAVAATADASSASRLSPMLQQEGAPSSPPSLLSVH